MGQPNAIDLLVVYPSMKSKVFCFGFYKLAVYETDFKSFLGEVWFIPFKRNNIKNLMFKYSNHACLTIWSPLASDTNFKKL